MGSTPKNWKSNLFRLDLCFICKFSQIYVHTVLWKIYNEYCPAVCLRKYIEKYMKYLFKCYIFYHIQYTNVCMDNYSSDSIGGGRGWLEIMQSVPWWCDYSSYLSLGRLVKYTCGLARLWTVSCAIYCYLWYIMWVGRCVGGGGGEDIKRSWH